jgi:hypothetical protein
MNDKNKVVYNFKVTGLQFGKYKLFKDLIEKDVELYLLRDPTNKWDTNAVAVIGAAPMPWDETKVLLSTCQIGWIPRDHNEELAALMDAGFTTKCVVTDHCHDWTADKEPGLYIEVTVEYKE